MVAINPYLNFMGKTEEAFNFYKAVFGGKFSSFQRFKDVPGGEKMAEADQEKIMHVSLPIGKYPDGYRCPGVNGPVVDCRQQFLYLYYSRK